MNTCFFVDRQVPEHLRNDYPKFLDFLTAYYKFNDRMLKNFAAGKDVDKLPREMLKFVRAELTKNFSAPLIDERKFIKHARELLQRKGTFDATELLFNIFFNDIVKIKEPNKQLLRVSAGNWFQTKFFHVVSSVALDISANAIFEVSNKFGSFSINVEKIEKIETNVFRVFFRSFNFLRLKLEDTVSFFDGKRRPIGTGSVVQRPTRFVVNRPGIRWRVGDIIRVPGSSRESLIRVSEVDARGAILNIEVYEHGYNHTPFQLVQTTPIAGKPFNPTFDYRFEARVEPPATQGGIPTVVFNNVIDLSNSTNGTTSNFVIPSRLQVTTNTEGALFGSGLIAFREEVPNFANSYYSENYSVNDPVIGHYGIPPTITINLSTRPAEQRRGEVFPSLEEWMESQTFLYAENEIITTERGFYLDDAGKLSNNDIRLQDGFFYQLFSYVIETEIDINRYQNIIEKIHPAGLIYFGLLRRQLSLRAKKNVTRISAGPLMLGTLDLAEIFATIQAHLVLHNTKIETDSVITSTSLQRDSSIFLPTSFYTPESGTISITKNKYITSNFDLGFDQNTSFGKNLEHAISNFHHDLNLITEKINNTPVISSGTIENTPGKNLENTISPIVVNLEFIDTKHLETNFANFDDDIFFAVIREIATEIISTAFILVDQAVHKTIYTETDPVTATMLQTLEKIASYAVNVQTSINFTNNKDFTSAIIALHEGLIFAKTKPIENTISVISTQDFIQEVFRTFDLPLLSSAVIENIAAKPFTENITSSSNSEITTGKVFDLAVLSSGIQTDIIPLKVVEQSVVTAIEKFDTLTKIEEDQSLISSTFELNPILNLAGDVITQTLNFSSDIGKPVALEVITHVSVTMFHRHTTPHHYVAMDYVEDGYTIDHA